MCGTPRYLVRSFLGDVVGLTRGEAVLRIFIGQGRGSRVCAHFYCFDGDWPSSFEGGNVPVFCTASLSDLLRVTLQTPARRRLGALAGHSLPGAMATICLSWLSAAE